MHASYIDSHSLLPSYTVTVLLLVYELDEREFTTTVLLNMPGLYVTRRATVANT